MQSVREQRRTELAALAAAVLMAGVATAWAGPEAKIYGNTSWTSQCKGKTVADWDNMTWAWYDEMEDEGWPKDGSWTNGSLSRNAFCDPDTGLSGCQDNVYADDADALMIFTHGFDNNGYWGGALRNAVGGDCTIDLNEMYLGDIDMEFLHLSSCNSMDDENLIRSRKAFSDPNDGASGRLHQIDAFHGIMWISTDFEDEYEDFAEDGFDIPLANAWVENLYKTDVTDGYDMCPVAVAVSTSLSNCLTRLTHERYNNIYSDPPGNNYVCGMAYVGCDPKKEDPFNF